jgi:hypothetical protein
MTTRLLNLTDQGLPESYVLIKQKPWNKSADIFAQYKYSRLKIQNILLKNWSYFRSLRDGMIEL